MRMFRLIFTMWKCLAGKIPSNFQEIVVKADVLLSTIHDTINFGLNIKAERLKNK